MAEYYTYLISSLPMLHFGARLPFSYEQFLLKCQGLIPDEDFIILKDLANLDNKHPVIKEKHNFECLLSNELVKIRAARKKIDPAKFLRPDGYAGPSVYHIALAAYRNPSPLEGERLLDEARWKFLEELSAGHYFDFSALIIYAYKLLILEDWAKMNTADHDFLLNSALPKMSEA